MNFKQKTIENGNLKLCIAVEMMRKCVKDRRKRSTRRFGSGSGVVMQSRTVVRLS